MTTYFAKRRITRSLFVVAATIAFSVATSAAVTVSLPAVDAFPGEAQWLDLVVDDVSGLDYTSFEARIQWDPSVAELVHPWVDSSGGPANGRPYVLNRDTPGELELICYGTTALDGGGPLARFRWQATGISGQNTALTITEFRFNESAFPALQNGSIAVGTPSTIAVALPQFTDVAAGSTFCASLTTDLSGEEVYSFQGRISWDPTVLRVGDPYFDRSGSLTGGAQWSADFDASTPGELAIAAWSTAALSSAGSLGCLPFEMVGPPGSWTLLRFLDFDFNEGFPAAATVDGRVDAAPGTDCIGVSVPDVGTVVYQPVTIAVNADSTTTGRGIYSFQAQFAWDEAIADWDPAVAEIDRVDLNPTGPAAAWNIAADATMPGQLGIAGWGTNPMTGTGTLFSFHLRGQGPNGGTTEVLFDYTFRFNEGAPCAIATQGNIVVPVEPSTWARIKARYR